MNHTTEGRPRFRDGKKRKFDQYADSDGEQERLKTFLLGEVAFVSASGSSQD